MTQKPWLSVVVPTRNSGLTLEPLLQSLTTGRRPKTGLEVLVIDNHSTDMTHTLCEAYGVALHTKGPERHAQRRHGAEVAQGEVLLFLDSDMAVEGDLLAEIAEMMAADPTLDALIVAERPHGAPNWWTKVKCTERGLYVGDDEVEAARVWRRRSYETVGGWSAQMIALEDWDLTTRAREMGLQIGRTSRAQLAHDEGYVTLGGLWAKKKYYGGVSAQTPAPAGGGGLWRKNYLLRRSLWRGTVALCRQGKLRLAVSLWVLVGVSGAGFVWGRLRRQPSHTKA